MALPKYFFTDCHEQIDILLPPFEKPLFLFKQISNIPRYIKAITIRIEKYPQRKIKDDELINEVHRLQNKWIEKDWVFFAALRIEKKLNSKGFKS